MDFRQIAKRRLPAPVFHYLDGGADDEVALVRNVAAFDDYELLPSQLHDVTSIDMQSTLFGETVDWPVMISPTGASKFAGRAGRARRQKLEICRSGRRERGVRLACLVGGRCMV